jgi:hypothetical protein
MPPMRRPSSSAGWKACSGWPGRAAALRRTCLNRRDGHVGQQQAADGLVDAAPLAQPAPPARSTAAPATTAPAAHTSDRAGDVARQRQHIGQRRRRPARPAPARPRRRSPPARRAPGCATHSAVSISGAARCSVFCQREPVAEGALEQQHPGLDRAHPGEPDEHAEQQQRRRRWRPTGRAMSVSVSACTPGMGRAFAVVIPGGDQRHPGSGSPPSPAPLDGPAPVMTLRGSDRADHAFDQVVHLLQLQVGLLEGLARRR